MSYQLDLAISARLDIQRTSLWLRTNRSRDAADKWLARLLKSINTLTDHPLRHPIADENDKFPEEIRQLLHGRGNNKYRILFTVRHRENVVVILYVRHAARDELEP